MVSIPKIVGIMSCGFVLCVGLSHATPASAANDTKAGPTDRKGGQGEGKGEQHKKMKADEMKAGQSPRKGGQAGGKDDAVEGSADKSTDKRNDKGQEEMSDKMKGGY